MEMPMIGYTDSLFKILQKEKIKSINDFTRIISVLSKKYSFPIVTSADLGLDSEQRIYKDEIIFKDSIIDLDKLVIANSISVKFYNCVIRGNIIILDKNSVQPLKEIVIDTCLFSSDFKVIGAENIDHISIHKAYFKNLVFNGLVADNISLTHNRIMSFVLQELKLKTFYTSNNRIEDFMVSGGIFKEIDFDHDQINLNNLLKSFKQKYYNSIFRKIKHSLLLKSSSIEAAFDNEFIQEQFEVINKTIGFIKAHCNINRNRKRKSDILFFESVFHQNNWIAKFFIWICGGFVRPIRFIFHGLFFWLAFAIIYYLHGCLFKVGSIIRSLNFSDSLYFSGITLVTVSYGDIVPVGISKFLVVIEGSLGVIVLSCFVVSLVRRFIGES